MTTLIEVEENTGNIFGDNNKIPQPEIVWQRKIDALEDAGLHKQRAVAIFEMRCQQATEMGFQSFSVSDLVKLMTGEAHNHTTEAERQNHEWFYNHHDDKLLEGEKNSWGCKPTDYHLMWRKNGWWLPPFNKVPKWSVRWGKLAYVKRQIPHGLALRIHDLKRLKIFNAFNYLGPIDSYEKDTEIKGVVTGSIWEIPPDNDGKFNTSGTTKNFYIGTWK
jgi:hypothetical protein